MILIFKYIFPRKYVGLAIWPFIVLKSNELKKDRSLMNHERIHLRQQLELLVIPFYIWYLVEWFVRWVRVGSPYRAYRELSFEREAYLHENDPDYLRERKPWSFLGYLGRQTL